MRRLQRFGPASEPISSRSKRPSSPHGFGARRVPRNADTERRQRAESAIGRGSRSPGLLRSRRIRPGQADSSGGNDSSYGYGVQPGGGVIHGASVGAGSSALANMESRKSFVAAIVEPSQTCGAMTRSRAAGPSRAAARPGRHVRRAASTTGRDPPDGEPDVQDRERGQDARRDDEGEDLDLAAAHVVAEGGDDEQRHGDEEEERRRSAGRRWRDRRRGRGARAARRRRTGGPKGSGRERWWSRSATMPCSHVTGTGTKVTVWYGPDGLGKVR